MVHTHFVMGMQVRLSFLDSTECYRCFSHSRLDRGVHLYFRMTKDPQPGSGKYDPRTFCSGHASMAVISLSTKCFFYSRLDRVYRRIPFWMTKDPQPGTGTYRLQKTLVDIHLWLSSSLFS